MKTSMEISASKALFGTSARLRSHRPRLVGTAATSAAIASGHRCAFGAFAFGDTSALRTLDGQLE